MKNILTSFFLILLFTVYLSAQGGTRPGGQQGPPPGNTQGPGSGAHQGPSFEIVDMDRDGKVSWDEAKAVFGKNPNWEAEFKQRDKNRDGVVDKVEFAGILDPSYIPSPAGGQPPAGILDPSYTPPPTGSGQRPPSGYQPPTGGTGTPPPGGYKPPTGTPPGGGQQGPSFDMVDDNHDGKISRKEAETAFGKDPNWEAGFKMRDKNGDGFVDKVEFAGIIDPEYTPSPTGGYQLYPATGGQLPIGTPPVGNPPSGNYTPTGTPPGGQRPPAQAPTPTSTQPPGTYPAGNPTGGYNPPGGYKPPMGGFTFEQLAGGDGVIDKDELQSIISKYPAIGAELKQRDKNRDGVVDKEEFGK